MKFAPVKAALLTALVTAGPLVAPSLTGSTARVEAAFTTGASAYQAVAPHRLADTRPDQGAFGFTRISSSVIRVQVAGIAGVPANASAAVLNVTGVNTTAPGFVTVYPAGTTLPTASNVNFDGPGQVVANMVTVKLNAGAVDVYMQRPMDVAIDVSGAYVPVGGSVRGGRLETLASGAYRVLDTRDRGFGVARNGIERVDARSAGVPADATAIVVNITATNAGVGFWTAYPLNQSVPNASNLNIDTPGQTRAGQAIVLLSGTPAFNVFSMGGGDLIVDVAGWFTGPTATLTTDGLFVPTSPMRLLDSRNMFVMPTWGGSTLEFSVLPPVSTVSAVAVNITGTQSMIGGFVTAFPAGVARPTASNLNLDTWDETIANHAIVRVSNRGLSLFNQQGLHMIADISGWYLGTPTTATLPIPINPFYGPATAQEVNSQPIGMSLAVGTGSNLDAVANLGVAATWNGAAQLAVPGNIVLFGHRTTHGAPFLRINEIPIGGGISLTGDDGHHYNYVVVRQDVTVPNYDIINNIGVNAGLATVQLVACTPPHSVTFRWVTTARLVSVT
ncbi:MAG: sortase domain-containing protein [Ilumatobacteraceae bacterium]